MQHGNVKVETDCWTIALALLFIAFHGSPDMVDSVIYKLTGEKNWTYTKPINGDNQ